MTPPPRDRPHVRRTLHTAAVVLAVIVATAGVAAAVRPLVRPGAPEPVAARQSPSVSPPTPDPEAAPLPPSPEPAERKPRKPGRKPAKPTKPSASPAPAELPAVPLDPKLRPFAGLSTWIDIYDIGASPRDQIAQAAAGGVELIFVQSARHKSTSDIEDPVRLGRVLELAHDRGMLVMVWYVPDFVRPARDLRRSQVAAAFTSPRGDRFDAFGLDIEIEDLPDPAKRSKRLLRLSQQLRDWAGPQFPMAAIVLPPLQLDLRPGWWPNFPFAELRQYYDVFIPMSYSSFRGTDAATTYRWNVANVEQMRALSQDPTLPVHIAGGIADNFPEVGTFVQAVRDAQALGGGLYDLSTTHPQAWRILQRLRVQPGAQ